MNKLLLVELKSDPESEGVVVDRIVTWSEDREGSPSAHILFGVHWMLPPNKRDANSLDALEYYAPHELTTIDVIDSMADLDEDEGEEEEEEEGEDA